MNIRINIRREKSQRESAYTLRMPIDELYNYTVDNYTYEDDVQKNVNSRKFKKFKRLTEWVNALFDLMGKITAAAI